MTTYLQHKRCNLKTFEQQLEIKFKPWVIDRLGANFGFVADRRWVDWMYDAMGIQYGSLGQSQFKKTLQAKKKAVSS